MHGANRQAKLARHLLAVDRLAEIVRQQRADLLEHPEIPLVRDSRMAVAFRNSSAAAIGSDAAGTTSMMVRRKQYRAAVRVLPNFDIVSCTQKVQRYPETRVLKIQINAHWAE